MGIGKGKAQPSQHHNQPPSAAWKSLTGTIKEAVFGRNRYCDVHLIRSSHVANSHPFGTSAGT